MFPTIRVVLINGERVEKKAQSFLARKPESESSRCFLGSSPKVLIRTEFWTTMTNDGFRYLQIGPAGVSYRWNWVTIDLIVIIIVHMKNSAKLGGLLPHWPDPRAGEQTEPRKQICRFSYLASLLPRVAHPFSMMLN